MTSRAIPVLGVDIGGANLKAAHTNGLARTRPFALWKDPAALPSVLAEFLTGWPEYARLAVTMTGELCDCFTSRREGVHAILDVLTSISSRVPMQIWSNDGSFVPVEEARTTPLKIASANWLAVATFAGRFVPEGPALLIDIGSTTTDLVPLLDGKPVPRGRTDRERLRLREMMYVGARRTPLNTLLGMSGAAECFATMQDVFLVLGLVKEDPSDHDTADGRPATGAAAHARLARMICADVDTTTPEERRSLAKSLLQRVLHPLSLAIETTCVPLPGPPDSVVLAGSGEFLARMVLQMARPAKQVISLADKLGSEISTAACAFAVAMLAAEEVDSLT
jgi:probable H4MPT-linked C1 transfer pathway protein